MRRPRASWSAPLRRRPPRRRHPVNRPRVRRAHRVRPLRPQRRRRAAVTAPSAIRSHGAASVRATAVWRNGSEFMLDPRRPLRFRTTSSSGRMRPPRSGTAPCGLAIDSIEACGCWAWSKPSAVSHSSAARSPSSGRTGERWSRGLCGVAQPVHVGEPGDHAVPSRSRYLPHPFI